MEGANMKKIMEVSPEKNTNPIRVIQFGEGNFLRAFVDYLIQRLNEETNYCGSVAIVQPIEDGLTRILDEQEGKYTHFMKGLEKGVAKSSHKIIDVIRKTVRPYEDFNAYLALARLPEAEIIISNTTEAGIVFEDKDTFETDPPKTFPAKLTRLLFERFKIFDGDMKMGFSIIPCELISDNGKVLKKAVIDYAKLWELGPEFIEWIHEANDFASTLVDRIVPGYPRESIDEVLEFLGYEDSLVVESERFLLWVIEDMPRIKERLPLEKLGDGIVFTADITPYKVRKVRILNGLHTFMVPIGLLAGIERVKACVEDERIGKLLNQVLHQEIIPSLDMDKDELEVYGNEVLNRFMNPYIKHMLMSISLNSIAKFETRLLPSLLGLYEKTGEVSSKIVFSFASLISYYKGSLGQDVFDVKDSDEVKAFFAQAWSKVDASEVSYRNLAKEILGKEEFWFMDLNEIKGLTQLLASKIEAIQTCKYLDLLEREVNE
jgi:tagaturonate reductase